MDHKIINYLNSENCRYSWSKLTPQQLTSSIWVAVYAVCIHELPHLQFYRWLSWATSIKKWSVVNWERELAGPWTTSIHDSQPGLESGSTNTITHKWIQRNKSRTYSWASNCKWFGDSTLEGNISRWKWSTVHQVHEWTSQLSTRRGLPRSES